MKEDPRHLMKQVKHERSGSRMCGLFRCFGVICNLQPETPWVKQNYPLKHPCKSSEVDPAERSKRSSQSSQSRRAEVTLDEVSPEDFLFVSPRRDGPEPRAQRPSRAKGAERWKETERHGDTLPRSLPRLPSAAQGLGDPELAAQAVTRRCILGLQRAP